LVGAGPIGFLDEARDPPCSRFELGPGLDVPESGVGTGRDDADRHEHVMSGGYVRPTFQSLAETGRF